MNKTNRATLGELLQDPNADLFSSPPTKERCHKPPRLPRLKKEISSSMKGISTEEANKQPLKKNKPKIKGQHKERKSFFEESLTSPPKEVTLTGKFLCVIFNPCLSNGDKLPHNNDLIFFIPREALLQSEIEHIQAFHNKDLQVFSGAPSARVLNLSAEFKRFHSMIAPHALSRNRELFTQLNSLSSQIIIVKLVDAAAPIPYNLRSYWWSLNES